MDALAIPEKKVSNETEESETTSKLKTTKNYLEVKKNFQSFK